MKRVIFGKLNRSGNLLHIEVPGAIVNIHIGLTDALGREVTRVSISPDDESRSPDENGYYWRLHEDGCRVIRDLVPGLHVTPSYAAQVCRYCGEIIEHGTDGLWADMSDAWANPPHDDGRDEIRRLACPQAPPRGSYPGLHEPAPEPEPE